MLIPYPIGKGNSYFLFHRQNIFGNEKKRVSLSQICKLREWQKFIFKTSLLS